MKKMKKLKKIEKNEKSEKSEKGKEDIKSSIISPKKERGETNPGSTEKIIKPVVRSSTLKKSTKSGEKRERNRRRSHKPKKTTTTNGNLSDSSPTRKSETKPEELGGEKKIKRKIRKAKTEKE